MKFFKLFKVVKLVLIGTVVFFAAVVVNTIFKSKGAAVSDFIMPSVSADTTTTTATPTTEFSGGEGGDA